MLNGLYCATISHVQSVDDPPQAEHGLHTIDLRLRAHSNHQTDFIALCFDLTQIGEYSMRYLLSWVDTTFMMMQVSHTQTCSECIMRSIDLPTAV